MQTKLKEVIMNIQTNDIYKTIKNTFQIARDKAYNFLILSTLWRELSLSYYKRDLNAH